MAAALTVTPAQVQVGNQITIDGTGFLPETVVTLTIAEPGVNLEVMSDVSGEINSDDLADRAQGTITSSGVDVTAADTITIGAVTYTFRAAPTTVANEVKVGGTAAQTLINLKNAINLTGVSGTDYGSGTVIHPTASAGAITPTTLKVYAKTAGTGGNALALSKVAATLSVSAANLAGGAASTGVSPILYIPQKATPLTISATDGVNTATKTVPVWTE